MPNVRTAAFGAVGLAALAIAVGAPAQTKAPAATESRSQVKAPAAAGSPVPTAPAGVASKTKPPVTTVSGPAGKTPTPTVSAPAAKTPTPTVSTPGTKSATVSGSPVPKTPTPTVSAPPARTASPAGSAAQTKTPAPAGAARTKAPAPGDKPAAPGASKAAPVPPPVAPPPVAGWSALDDAQASPAANRITAWIAASHDNGTLPYLVIDKKAAAVLVYDPRGKLQGASPVLIGVASGDDSSPGVGSKNLAEIGPAEKTTPAGRFVAKYGEAAGGQRVLWVDWETSVALHPVVTGNKRERRLERLLSPSPVDNRITFGCINVPAAFYKDKVYPLFRKSGGVVYILPDTKPLETVFPRVLIRSPATQATGSRGAADPPDV